MSRFSPYIFTLTFILFATGVFFTGCYKDKGNYDYTELPDFRIDTTQLRLQYLVLQFEELDIEPPLIYSGDPSVLSYNWKIYTRQGQTRPVTDISSEKALRYTVSQTPGSYTIEYTVTNTVTGERAMERFELTVTNALSDGWMVLHEKGGVSDIDFLKTQELLPALQEDELIRDVYSSLNDGEKITSKAIQIVNSKMKRNATRTDNMVYVLTEESITRLSGDDFTKVQSNAGLFFLPPPVIKPQRYTVPAGTLAFYEVLINNGDLHEILTGYTDNNGQFSTRMSGDYIASPYVPMNPPILTTAIYDEKNGRFLSLGFVQTQLQPYREAVPGSLFDLNTINKKLLYLEGGFNNYDYCVFADREGGDARYLYVIAFSRATAGTAAIGLYNMSGAQDIAQAACYAIGNRGNVFYYAAGSTIYFYDYSGSNASRIEHSFPSAEKITSMKLFKKTGHALNGKLLFVATFNETSGEGKLYQVPVNEVNGVVDAAGIKSFSGFGKIIDMNLKQL